MTKIIDINGYPKYQQALTTAVDFLVEADNIIDSYMVALATEGKWKQWSDEQPEGSVFTFTEEMLRNTGDENVDTLCELRDKLYDVLGKLRKNQSGKIIQAPGKTEKSEPQDRESTEEDTDSLQTERPQPLSDSLRPLTKEELELLKEKVSEAHEKCEKAFAAMSKNWQ
jgi:ElaB/YqjD/DUF883 family membrane-anchored ribosome-binding protein